VIYGHASYHDGELRVCPHCGKGIHWRDLSGLAAQGAHSKNTGVRILPSAQCCPNRNVHGSRQGVEIPCLPKDSGSIK
jgi:hypothetical protein